MLPSRDAWWKYCLYHFLSIVPGAVVVGVLSAVLIYVVVFAAKLLGFQTSGGMESLPPAAGLIVLAPVLLLGVAFVVTWFLSLIAYYKDARYLAEIDADYRPVWPLYVVFHVPLGPLTAFAYVVRRYMNTDVSFRG